MSFDRIPEELRLLDQWVVWRLEDIGAKKPTKIPYCAKTGKLASVTDKGSWCSFADAVACVADYSGIGFVFTDSDPYTFLDLDDTDGDAVATDRQIKVYREMDSYAEISPSGKGLHIIIRGHIPSGRRRSYIEVYSTGRYATFTGNVYNDKPIAERQEALTALYEQMGGSGISTTTFQGEVNEKYSDQEIIEQCKNATNSDKFNALFNGEWSDKYKSQSEADLALINIIGFYTKNRNQINRLFLSSSLGKRDKAKRKDYINWMINKSFDRELPQLDFDGLENALNDKISKKPIKASVAQLVEPAPHKGFDVGSTPTTSTIPMPPGLMGEIAQFIYQASPLPVPEIALAGAIGLMAGVCGRAYNISKTGLNQYVLMLAKTGMGKEAMRAGIDKLMGAIKFQVPTSNTFLGPRHIASGQALIKYVHKKSQCFVSVLGEFGLTLQRISSERASSHDVMLKQILLELYNVSGHQDMFQPSIQADLEKNTEPTPNPAFSLLAESTPHSFYSALSEDMIAEGLLPRFMFIEYNGERVEDNPYHKTAVPSIQLVEKFAALVANVENVVHSRRVIEVNMTDEAEQISQTFSRYARQKINQTSDEVILSLWNRAHLKALKFAGLIAVGCNMWEPKVTKEHLDIAIGMVQNDIKSLQSKFEAGEIGSHSSDVKQLADMTRMIKDFITKDWNYVRMYCQSDKSQPLHYKKIIPYTYLNRRTAALSSFRLDRIGATGAIKKTLQTLIDSDKIRELGNEDKSKLGTIQRLFIVSDPTILD